jgi:hypothetical protein
MSPATTLISTFVASRSSTSGSSFNIFVILIEAMDCNKFSVKSVSLLLTSGKKLNPGGHAKLRGISVIEKL